MSDTKGIDPLDVTRPFPVGMTEFLEWSARIIALAGNFADEDSMKFALCSQLIHLPYDKAEATDRYFVNCLRKAAANQVASQVFHDIKIKQQEAAKVADTTTHSEVTPKASDEQKRVQ